MINSRQIRNWQTTNVLMDLIQSLFVALLLQPCSELWMVSPWISDITVLENSAGEFRSLVPDWERVPIRLSQVLVYLAEHQCNVYVVTRANQHNQAFLQILQDRLLHRNSVMNIRCSPLLHEKGLLAGDLFFLSGSFNFTFYGVSLNEEVAYLYSDPDTISTNRVVFHDRWERDDL